MKITVDTNVLLRAFVEDDPAQSQTAIETLEGAEIVAVSLQSLCEFAWVLKRQYEASRADIASGIRALLDTQNVVVNRPAAEAGLTVLEAGGDFADGVIAYEGNWLGGETFVSFDKKAVKLLTDQGQSARLLG
ncbi:MAG: VapC toxin family PIN domain ribonuclease [Yangia sp.]|nr:VapC toxin family PIN domain ribonuclease [Salipiger sp.]